MNKGVQHWLDLAEYDISVAESLLNSGHYIYVMFCCQQAVEKTLKALIHRDSKDHPPRIHNLLELANRAGVDLSEEQELLLKELTQFYKKTRYTDRLLALTKDIDKSFAEKVNKFTKEFCKWLRNML